jgi:hypothetical protein
MPLILGANSLAGGGYEIDNSLRFNDGSSDSLTRTPASTSNQKTFTISFWIKRSALSTQMYIFETNAGNYPYFHIRFRADNTLDIEHDPRIADDGLDIKLQTTQLFRDVSAWYHIVLAVDTTQATDTNRCKLYVNGEQVTSFSSTTYPTLNLDITGFNSSSYELGIGKAYSSTQFFDGYMSEIYEIDGQALDPTSFGEFDEDSGIWKPIAYEGTYGTNGFYLEFKDSSALGDDTSGEGNDFTVNNLTSIDQTTDTPTNNFCTLNPLRSIGGNVGTYSEGNTTYTASPNDWQGTVGTIGATSGKWYWEWKVLSTNNNISGIVSDIVGANDAVHDAASVVGGFGGYIDSGNFHARFAESDISGWDTGSVGVTFTTNDIVNVALDMDNKFLYFGKNGTWMKSGVPTSGATGTGGIDIGTPYDTVGLFAIPAVSIYATGASGSINFGNPSFTISSGNSDANNYGNFEYAVPSGYYALNTKNLAEYG